MMKIVIDAGHGGKDPGAIGDGVKEKDITLLFAKKLRQELHANGHYILMTRETDSYPTLSARVKLANWNRVDLFVSIHCNAAVNELASGFEVWTSIGDTKADKYAEEVINHINRRFPALKLRRDFSDGDADKEKDYTVLADTSCPAILIETGFISNSGDRENLINPLFQDDMCLAISDAIQKCCA